VERLQVAGLAVDVEEHGSIDLEQLAAALDRDPGELAWLEDPAGGDGKLVQGSEEARLLLRSTDSEAAWIAGATTAARSVSASHSSGLKKPGSEARMSRQPSGWSRTLRGTPTMLLTPPSTAQSKACSQAA